MHALLVLDEFKQKLGITGRINSDGFGPLSILPDLRLGGRTLQS